MLHGSERLTYLCVLHFLYGKVVADTERAMLEALEKQFFEVLNPLKDSKISALKYVQRLTKKGTYSVPKEVRFLCFETLLSFV